MIASNTIKGITLACALAVGPTLLIAYALYASRSEKLGDPGTAFANVSSLLFAFGIALLGPPLYWLTARPLARRRALAAAAAPK